MKRREFLKNACGAGLCGCAVASLFAPMVARATDEPKHNANAASEPKPEKPPPEDGRIKFAQDRYAKLLAALSERVEPAIVSAALQDVGAYCASNFKGLDRFVGKPDDFLAMVREKWHGQADYDAAKGTVTLAFPATGRCPCALVNPAVTPATVCECSLGWQKKVFSAIFSRPVEVTLKGSLLRGADRCSFAIRVA